MKVKALPMEVPVFAFGEVLLGSVKLIDYKQIEAMIAVLRDSQLVEMEVSAGDFSLRLQRPASAIRPPAPKAASVAPSPAVPAAALPILVTAPLVGLFRAVRGASVGATVKAGQVLGQIEAMRLLSDCIAPQDGTLYAVHVEDGQPVEYGQPLFEILTNE